VSTAKLKGIGNDENIIDIVLAKLDKYFKKYFFESEIDIICDIEREKSPYYPNRFTKKKIKTVSIPIINKVESNIIIV